MLLADALSLAEPNWTVLLPVVVGALAVWYLLPTPTRRPIRYCVLGVAVAVTGFATFLWHGFDGGLPVQAEVFLFAAFALMAVTFSILMITQRNAARAAIFFAVVVLSVCGLFLLLAAPFLMAATIIVYAGAIIVTFLFVIMLSQQTGASDANDRSREPSLAAAVGFLLLGTLLVVLQRVYVIHEVDAVLQKIDKIAKADAVDESLKQPAKAKAFLKDIERIRDRLGYGKIDIPTHVDGKLRREKDSDAVSAFRDALGHVQTIDGQEVGQSPGFEPDVEEVQAAAEQLHYELSYLKAVREGRITPETEGMKHSPYGQADLRKPTRDPAKAVPKRLPNANVAALGRTLFTDHLLAIEIAGTLLLVATIGAIAIAGNRAEKTA